MALVFYVPCFAQEDKPASPAQRITAAFTKADRDSDKRLTLDEYLANRGDPKVATRDFKLFDLDADGKLTRDEFSTIPTTIEARYRGPLPDPMLGVVDQAVAALDATLGNWNERPNEEIDPRQLIAAVGSSLGDVALPGADPFGGAVVVRGGNGIDLRAADPNGDGKVTRDEARRFLEIQLGVRRFDGKLLREPNGRVVNYHLYLHVDENKNDRLDRQEYIERAYAGEKAAAEFDAGDTDRDGSLSFDEWCQLPIRSFEDPIQQFRQYDTDLDGKLSPDELLAGSPEWKKKLAKYVFPGFDLDKDGTLSLDEYRLTIQANMIAHWTYTQLDRDDDGKLSFAEFQFDQQFPLLRLVFFHRLDANGDNLLDPNEFDFHVRVPNEFFVMNADGAGWKSLFRFDGHSACGSPAVSPDGKSIAFDAWESVRQQNSAIYIMDLDKREPRQIRSGMMPSWSPDGKKLCYSMNSNVWITTTDARQLVIASQGWGGQWSPDGKKIAFSQSNAINLIDVESEKIDVILDASENPYTSLYWNMGWSPDSKRLCFKGSKADSTIEVGTVHVTGKPNLKVHHTGTRNVNADFAWHPNGHRIVFAMHCPERGFLQLYEFDPDKDKPPRLVPGQDPSRNNRGMCWTPDGQRLIVISGDY